MRALARVVVWAALLGIGIPNAISGQNASAAPTTDSPSASVEFDLYTSINRHHPSANDSLFGEEVATGPAAIPVVFQNEPITSNRADPTAQSPAIDLPPAVASGFGLLGVLAVCMTLRRFAYRPASFSRRH